MPYKLLVSSLLLLILSLNPIGAYSQSDSKESIQQTILDLFEGMRTNDSTLFAQSLSKMATLHTVTTDSLGNTILQKGDIQQFKNMIAAPKPFILDEQIISWEIHVDDLLASVWTPYKFYRGKEFSHCGSNSFNLMKTSEGWKIISIVDVRKQEGCN